MEMNTFMKATKEKYRFTTRKGSIGVEELWDLSMTDLSKIHEDLNDELVSMSKGSLLDDETMTAQKKREIDKVTTKMEVVATIFKTKKEEKIAREKAAETKAQKEKIAAILADKEDEALKSLSTEQLKNMLQNM